MLITRNPYHNSHPLKKTQTINQKIERKRRKKKKKKKKTRKKEKKMPPVKSTKPVTESKI
jgi:hypothetical protein